METTKTNASPKNYVIRFGKDCDGAECAKVTRYTSEPLALHMAQQNAEYGDGEGYAAVDVIQAQLFATQNDLTLPDYAFNEDMEIVDDITVNQFDAHNQKTINTRIIGPSFNQTIDGDGFFIIVNPNSDYVSFCKERKDVCFGDITETIIPNYTNKQYANEYGDRLTGMGITVREFMRKNCRLAV